MTNPRVGAYVIVPENCPTSYVFTSEGDVEVRFGQEIGGFEMVFTRQALQRLVELGGQALEAPAPYNAAPDWPTPYGSVEA